MQNNRPAVYLEGDGTTVVYRASALGHCLRQLWAARSGMPAKPIPAPIRKAMDEGTELEPKILELLHSQYEFTFADGPTPQAVLNLGAWNGVTLIVRGVPDEYGCPAVPGLDNSLQAHRPIDVKAFSQSLVTEFRNKGFTAFPHYAWQQTVYALAYESESFIMPIYNKDTGKIEEWSLVPHGPLFSLDQIRDRVLSVEEAFASGGMPSDCPADYACPYPYLHDQKNTDVLPEDAVTLAQAGIKLRHKIAVFTQARKTVDGAMKEHLAPDTIYHLDGYRIQRQNNSRRFNTDLAKELLTSAEVDWQNDPDFWIPGEGDHVQIDPPKKEKNDDK